MLAKVPACVAYGLDLSVAGRILSGQNPVVPAADNFPVLHDDGAEGASLAAFQIAAGLLRCRGHEPVLPVSCHTPP